MFNTISWHSYWVAIALATALYYLLVYLLYLKSGSHIISSEGYGQLAKSTGLVSSTESPVHPSLFKDGSKDLRSSGEQGEEHVIEACMDELTAFFDNQKKSKPVKSELMHSLYNILQKYPSLKNSDYKESLTNVIATQCENMCSIHLSADELKGVWLG